ncbi:hypothetical protein [Limosilactobacillus mucosae]|uniref:hypothetical protein n=1 Tax=Limosilactobacillus mucosae TaxID=97478 RepID=UPI0022E3EC7A|nr:hypothetical protein [Limosilactobacillus mucosae]
MKANSSNFQLNIIFGFVNSVVSVVQTFWFIPYIKEYLGTTAYGYISVVNGLSNTLFVLVSAIGSMGTRFILVTLERKYDEESNEYFNTELFAMIVGSLILGIIALVLSFNLGKVMRVDHHFYKEVQVLLILTINTLILQLLASPFSASFFFKNTIYITYILYTLDYLGRITLTVIMFHHNMKVLWSAVLSTNIVYILSLVFYMAYSRHNIPSLSINLYRAKLDKLIELVKSGVWIAVSSAGNMMVSSLNTYFANILCGVFITGIYASIMQFNIMESMVLSVLVNSLLPKMFKLFSHNDSKNLFFYTIYSMTLVSLILGVVSGGIVIYGNDFMNVWMGNKFTGYAPLIFLTVAYLPFTLPSQVINQSFTVMNKVMMPAMFTILTGLMNILLSIIFVKLFQWNIYGVALASLVVQVFRDCILFPCYFYKISMYFDKKMSIPFFAALASIVITIAICFVIRLLIKPTSILAFISSVMIAGGIALSIILCIFNFISRKLSISL